MTFGLSPDRAAGAATVTPLPPMKILSSGMARNTRTKLWRCKDSFGGPMPLDVLDQETVNKLPRLSELETAYGVQVNAIDVDELFDLYECTGFLYPEKAARLRPYLQLVKENWDRMLRAGESVL